ncbi:galactokinase [Neotamlana laminarinivorans]|uniref:Galactokinase n=1 Tax=Neotamlana laminarinivorans TaxID=2883124 RepID=A0A9X1HYE8_9FLAO|nr:galactokinase [Tamlana laminarinivorans]MCB4797253.1 galactokinase [Tamlana laminarinivorans]
MNQLIINEITKAFTNTFKVKPLLIFSPGRINIIGEHTDYNEGFVFPGAVNKGIYAAIEKTNHSKSTIYALDKKSSFQFNLKSITALPEGSWENYILGVVAELLKLNKPIGNFNFVFKGDIPAGAGMSSSAALENSVVFGLNNLFNLKLTKTEMIFISQKAEHNYVGVKCGIMDQYASMFGKKNYALLLDCRSIKAKPFKIDFENYQLVLINTNVKHSLSDSAYNNRRSVCESISKTLKIKALRDATEGDLKRIENDLTPENYQKALFIIQENNRVQKASAAMLNKDLIGLGNLMYKSHEGLTKQYKVSCNELDFLVDEAKASNYVIGARMMGGGFGGCTINLIEKNHTTEVLTKVSQAYKSKFNLDCSIYIVELTNGTHVISQTT